MSVSLAAVCLFVFSFFLRLHGVCICWQGSSAEEQRLIKKRQSKDTLRYLLHGGAYETHGQLRQAGGGLGKHCPEQVKVGVSVLSPFLESPPSLLSAEALTFSSFWRLRVRTHATATPQDMWDAKVLLTGAMAGDQQEDPVHISDDEVLLEFFTHMVDDRGHPHHLEVDVGDDCSGMHS